MKKAYIYTFLVCLLVLPTLAQSQTSNQKIFLIFNQPKYAAGDTAFFRGQLTSSDLVPVTGKKIVNLKLIGSTNDVALHNRVMFQNGFCVNQLVLPKDLAPDVYSLIAFTDENVLSYFQVPIIISNEKEFVINADDKAKFFNADVVASRNANVKISTDKPRYGVRQLVTVEVALTDADDKPLQADNIVSVVHEDLFKNASWQNLLQQGSANSYTPTDPLSAPSTRVVGNRKFPSYFSGRITMDSIPPAMRDSVLITFYFTNSDFIYGLYADPKGKFEFPLFKEFGDEDLFYTLSSKTGVLLNKAKLILDQAPAYNLTHLQKSKNDSQDLYSKLSKEKAAIGRSFNYYLVEAKKTESEESDLWMDTDFEARMDKYESFVDMREVLTNIIQAAKYVKIKEVEGVRVFMQEGAMYARKDPLFIINGIMTNDTQYFLRLDPATIEKVGVLRTQKSLARFGALGKNGIILVKSRYALDDLKTDRMLSIKGISKARKFTTPKYGEKNQNSKVPDLRTTLYWNPRLVSDKGVAKFSFYTGDAVGTFKIKVNGIAEGNKFYTGELTFEVQKEVN